MIALNTIPDVCHIQLADPEKSLLVLLACFMSTPLNPIPYSACKSADSLMGGGVNYSEVHLVLVNIQTYVTVLPIGTYSRRSYYVHVFSASVSYLL